MIQFTAPAQRQLDDMACSPKISRREMRTLHKFLLTLDDADGEDKGPHSLGGRLMYFRPCPTIRILAQQTDDCLTVMGFIIRSPKVKSTARHHLPGYTLDRV